jgi:hypothetical protein
MYRGICGKDHTITKVTEAFRLVSLKSITLDNGPEKFERIIDGNARRHKPAQPSAIVARPQIEGVFVRSPSHKANLREKWACAPIQPDTQADGIVAEVASSSSFELAETSGSTLLSVSATHTSAMPQDSALRRNPNATFSWAAVLARMPSITGFWAGVTPEYQILRGGEAEIAVWTSITQGGLHASQGCL